jgi:hypothetical protein
VTSHRLIKCDVSGGAGRRAELTASIDGYADWVVEARVTFDDYGPEVAELRIRPLPPKSRELPGSGAVPAGGLPSRLLRRINVGQLVDLVHAYARAEAEDFADWSTVLNPYSPADAAALADLSAAVGTTTQPRPRPGRKGHPIDHYLLWASRYAAKVSERARHPISELARDHLAELGYSLDQLDKARVKVRDTVTDARRRYDLLTSSGRGRAGGALTPRALDLIAERTKGQNDG